jgi:rubrerythrin
MGLSDIIRIAEEIELEMEERHQNIYYTVNHPELKKLFSFLIKADGEHIAKLKTYLTN